MCWTSTGAAQTVSSADSPAHERASRSAPRQITPSVTISVQNVTIGEVLRRIARQTNREVIYNNSNAQFAKRITLSLKNVSLMEAFAAALRGTGMKAAFAPDGETVVIRPEIGGKTDSVNVGTISVRVLDSSTRNGVSGVTVAVAGLQASVLSDRDGQAVLREIPLGNHTVTARLFGFKSGSASVTVNSGASARMNIVLVPTATALTEVVTTATGAQRRLDISNDVVKINADRLMQEAPIRTVTDLLVAAQVPGMIVTRSSGDPGAPARIRLGGVGSISQNNDPVVIVDGVWVKSSFSTPDIRRQLVGTGEAGQLLPSRLDAIDPSTIESIEIVRGPAAATLYGPDAANGVIKITTKRGTAGPARWDVQLSRDWQNPVGTRPPDYEAFGHTPFSNEPIWCEVALASANVCIQDSVRAVSQSHPLLTQEGAGMTNSVSATVSGGTRQILYSLSASLRDRQGMRKIPEISLIRSRMLDVPLSGAFRHPSQMRDRNLSSRLTMSPRPGLDITLNLDGSQTNSDENKVAASITNAGPFDSTAAMFYSAFVAPEKNGSTTTRGLVSLTTQWSPYAWWMTSSTLGIDRESTRETRTASNLRCISGTCTQTEGQDQSAGRQQSVYTMRVQSTFSPNLGWAGRFVRIQPGVLFDLRRQVNYRYSGSIRRQGDVATAAMELYDGPTSALGGLAVNANIRLFDRISFDPAIRKDFSGASALQNNRKTYPRFGTSWLVSEEGFFPKTSLLTTLRLRGAFGYASVQPRLSQLYGRYTNKTSNVNGVTAPSIEFTAIGNPNLQPERSVEVETGFDADLFDERVMLTVTYSNKQNHNTLVDRTLAPSAGVTSTRQENIAKVVNHTTSIQLMARAIDRDHFRLRVTSTIGFLRNEIKSLGSGVSPYGTFDQRYVEGYPVGGLWQRPVLAVVRLEDGSPNLANIVLADSMSYMGTNLPRYTMGHNIEVGFLRHFTLNAFFDYKGAFMQKRASIARNMRGYWDMNATPEEKLLPTIISTSASDLQTVTELRFQSASLSVNVPPVLVRHFRAQSIQVALQGANLGLWTQYRGRDPGINSSPVGELLSDSGNAIGLPRSYSLQFRVRY